MSRNLTLDQLELMGIVQCKNPECNAAYTGDESTCRSCGTPLNAVLTAEQPVDKRKSGPILGMDTARNNSRPSVDGNGSKTRPRTKRTKAEAMALDRARRSWPECDVIEQPMKLQLTDGGSYTPDLCVRDRKQKIIIIEVKGGYRGPGWEQGIERYKRAKYEWGHWFELRLWTWDRKQQTWRIE